MDLSRMSKENKLTLCRQYFFSGFLLLPFMWAINAIWFAREAFCVSPSYPQQKTMKKYVVLSAIAAVVCFIAMVSWYVVFINNRSDWGIVGDQLAFFIPKGSP